LNRDGFKPQEVERAEMSKTLEAEPLQIGIGARVSRTGLTPKRERAVRLST